MEGKEFLQILDGMQTVESAAIFIQFKEFMLM